MGARTGRMKGACFAVKSLGSSHATQCIISSHKELLNVKCRWWYFVGARERERRSDSHSYSTSIVSNVVRLYPQSTHGIGDNVISHGLQNSIVHQPPTTVDCVHVTVAETLHRNLHQSC